MRAQRSICGGLLGLSLAACTSADPVVYQADLTADRPTAEATTPKAPSTEDIVLAPPLNGADDESKNTESGSGRKPLPAPPSNNDTGDAGSPVTPPPANPPAEETPLGFKTLDYAFNDMVYYINQSETQCWRLCTNKPGCVGIAVGSGKDASHCWLKSRLGFGEWNELRTTYIRSSVALAMYTRVRLAVDDSGPTLSKSPVQDAQACAETCRADGRCAGFVVRRSTSECILKSKITGSGEACADCVRYCDPARGSCP